jgi:hypothetical protein
VEYVHQSFGEAAYQLCDGFAVNMGYFSVHPNVGGTFDKATEGHDTDKHPVTFRFRPRAPLRALAGRIVVEVEGLADSSGYIDEFIDVATEAVNETLTSGGRFSVSDHRIKVVGDSPDIGIYFASAADPAQRAKVAGHLAENAPHRLIGIVPASPAPGAYTLEIVPQHSSGSNSLLKHWRTRKVLESRYD